MLKLMSGQHPKPAGGALHGPPGIVVPHSTEASLAGVDRGQSPAAAAAASQQQPQSHKAGASTTPRTPHLLAMVHMLDQQVHQLVQQCDDLQPVSQLAGEGVPWGPQQSSHSVEAPAVVGLAHPQAVRHGPAVSKVAKHPAVATGQAAAGTHNTSAGDLWPSEQGMLRGAPDQQLSQQHEKQQQTTLEVPALVINSRAAVQKTASVAQHQWSRHDSSTNTGGLKPSTLPEVLPGNLRGQDLSCSKAPDQAATHSRGLMAAGAYVLQPHNPAGRVRQLSPPPEQRQRPQQSAQCSVLLAHALPAASAAPAAAFRKQPGHLPAWQQQSQQAAPHQEQQQHAAVLLQRQPAVKHAPHQPGAVQGTVGVAAAANRQQQQVQQCQRQEGQPLVPQLPCAAVKLQPHQCNPQVLLPDQRQFQGWVERPHQVLQPPHAPKPHLPPVLLQQNRPPVHQPQQQQQQQQQRQQVRLPHAAPDMDLDMQDAAGALDLLSEAAIAAAAAEEMYPGMPSPMRLTLLSTQGMSTREVPPAHACHAVHNVQRRSSDGAGPSTNFPAAAKAEGPAGEAAATIPAPAAATIAAEAASQRNLAMHGQDAVVEGRRAGAECSSAGGLSTKRSRFDSESGGTHPATAAAGPAVYAGSEVTAAGREAKRMKGMEEAGTHAAVGSAPPGLEQQQQQQRTQGQGTGLCCGQDSTADLGGQPDGAAGSASQPADPGSKTGMPAAIRAAVAELAAMAAASTAGNSAEQAARQVTRLVPASSGPACAATVAAPVPSAAPQPLQLPAGVPVAFVLANPQALGNGTLYISMPGAFMQMPQRRVHAAAGSSGAGVGPAAAAAGGGMRGAVPGLSSAGLAGASQGVAASLCFSPSMAPAQVAAAGFVPPAASRTGPQAYAAPAALAAADCAAADANAAAHDLLQLATAAAAEAAAQQGHSQAARPAAAAGSALQQHAQGRQQRKSAAAAAAFIAAAVAAADEGRVAGSLSHTEAPHISRHHRRSPPSQEQQYTPLHAAAEAPALAISAAAAAAAAAAEPYALAAAAHGPRQMASGTLHGFSRARAASSSGSMMACDADSHSAECLDGDVYVLEDEDGEDSEDDDRRAQARHRTSKERVLSNRLAASRSYQRRKEEMLRLEATHARMQMERQALEHALREAEQELQVHQEIALALSGHAAATAAPAGTAALPQPAAGVATGDSAADHAYVHTLLLQRVQGAMKHQAQQRLVHHQMVEEAALAAAAAADACQTDGAGSSGSGSV